MSGSSGIHEPDHKKGEHKQSGGRSRPHGAYTDSCLLFLASGLALAVGCLHLRADARQHVLRWPRIRTVRLEFKVLVKRFGSSRRRFHLAVAAELGLAEHVYALLVIRIGLVRIGGDRLIE